LVVKKLSLLLMTSNKRGNPLKNRTMTALENQINKLSKNEREYFNKLNKMGIISEDALSHVLIASATGLIKK